MEPAVRVELTTNGLQIRCSATELRRQTFSKPWKNEARIMRIIGIESTLDQQNYAPLKSPRAGSEPIAFFT